MALDGFHLYYVHVRTGDGVLPVRVSLRRIPAEDPCWALSWESLDWPACDAVRADNVFATREPLEAIGLGEGLPWVLLELQ